MPLRLAGIEARYGARCIVREGGEDREETLSLLECQSNEPEAVAFFCTCVDQLVGLLGPRPTTRGLSDAVDRLVAMFQSLANPPRKEITGVIGELCVILAARNSATAVRAWHAMPEERYDFVASNLRVDAKATGTKARVHRLTLDQAVPPPGTVGVLASVQVRAASGGATLRDLVDRIERKIGRDFDTRLKLQEGLALILGSGLRNALDASFDLEEALSSLRFYRLDEIPAIRPPVPAGVFDVSFSVDLDDIDPIEPESLGAALELEVLDLLP
jgi:hypothetical protein